ncbi:MAG TPA: bifunctional diguanylate cyclase/phosphodiesterase, partial [Pseudomonas sp.]|nr:bifunctional diguanylate cyclase/phosphodiesterase [Pseudomonas sp.]
MSVPAHTDGSDLPPDLHATFARRILPAMVSLLAFTLLAAAFAIVHIALRIDHDADAQTRFLADKAIATERDWLLRSIVDYAFWGDAYLHLKGPSPDLDWA